jgi:hypothetical protein
MSARVLFVLLVRFCFAAAAFDRWGAYKTHQVLPNVFDKSSFGTLNSFSTSIQTSSGDKALILVNGDYFRKGPGSGDYILNFDLNTVVGSTTTDLTGTQYFTDLQNNDARETQPINFMFLDTAPATSVQYMANVKGAGKLSHITQVRCFDVAVFPSTTTIASSAAYTALSVTGNGNGYTSWSGDVTVSLSSATDRVLLLMSVPFFGAATGNSHAAFTIYRGGSAGTIATPNLVVQTIGGTDNNAGRQVTGAYVDVPGTTGSVVYAGMVRKLNTYAGAPTDFTLSRGGNPYRSLIAIVIPNSYIGHAQISSEYLVTSETWVTVPGLTVPSAGYAVSDYVMIVVNINYYCTSGSAATGYFTIFQNDLPLPGHNGTTGMHVVRIIRRNETIAASMTAIVSPGTTNTVVFSVKVKVDGGAFTVGGYGQTSSITVVTQPQFTGTTPTANPTAAPSRPTVAPTVSPSEIPTCKPTTAPSTVVPTKSPTSTPTWAPTNPTLIPTAVPTDAPKLCGISCTFAGQFYASPRTLVGNVQQLPSLFVVEFDATIPRVLGGSEGPVAVLELVNQAAPSQQLLAIRMTTSTAVAVVYNNVVIDGFSVHFVATDTSTHFKIWITPSSVVAVSSDNAGWVDNMAFASLVDTTGLTYSLYVNAPTTPSGASVLVSDITIKGKPH